MEARLLQMICQAGLGNAPDGLSRELREEALTRLRSYPFRTVAHQVLFDCLWQMPRHRPDLVRDLLPARLVQAGFPDFDLAPFFEPHGLTETEARELLGKLAGDVHPAEGR